MTLSSILLGLAAGMVVAGMPSQAALTIDSVVSRRDIQQDTFIAVALLVLACGARMPRGLALWISAKAWQRFVQLRRSETAVLLHVNDVDPGFRWIVLSVVSLLSGLVIAALPIIISCVTLWYGWMGACFVWSPMALTVLDAGTAVAMLGPSLMPLGFAVCCAHRMSRADARWDPRVTGALLVGSCIGVVLVSVSAGIGRRPDLLLVASALPALVVALLGAIRSSSASCDSTSGAIHDSVAVPQWRDRWPGLLRGTIVVLAGGGAAAMYTFGGQALGESDLPGPIVAWLLGTMGLGMVTGCRVRIASVRSIGGFGVACAAAGLVLTASSVRTGASPESQAAWRLLLACASLFTIGVAVSYGWMALMNRVSGMAMAGAVLFSRCMVCAALSIWMGLPIVKASLGPGVVLLAIALTFLAVGGALVIHEPKYSPRTRRARLGTIFTSVATMILVAWITPQWWRYRKRIRESSVPVPMKTRALTDPSLDHPPDPPIQSVPDRPQPCERGLTGS